MPPTLSATHERAKAAPAQSSLMYTRALAGLTTSAMNLGAPHAGPLPT